MSANKHLVESIKTALYQARGERAHHVVEDGDPPGHVRGRAMALVVTHLEEALVRALVATGQLDLGE